MTISLMNPTDPVTPNDNAGFGALETSRGCLPLTRLDVRADVHGLTSRVTLRQTFVNGFDEPLEATYIFPLPDRGAVTTFTLSIAGRRVDGVLKERGQARQDYDRAIASGHRAAIAEEERPDVFTMRAGNIAPGESAVVELEIIAPLEVVSSEATFRFPLVVAPRYIPGTPLPGPDVGAGQAKDTDAVPDASRISPPVLLPGSPNPVALSIEVDIDTGGLPLTNLRSTLHAIDSERSEHRAHVRVQPGERVDRDFILRFDVGHDSETSASCLVLPGSGRAPSILNLELVAPIEHARTQRPRDVVFILDRSGSMSGWKMLAARRALGRMVDTLTPADRFNILAFDNHVETMPGTTATTLIQATNRGRWKALEFLAKVDARGGTEMAGPLRQGADQLAGGYQDRDRVLVLITDGQVGNEDQILADLGPRLQGTRVFTVGIDRAVNAGFLHRLADLGGGHSELVESEDRLDEVMDRIHHRIDAPWLTELTLDLEGGGDLKPSTLTPQRVSGLFAGTPLRLRGELFGPTPSHILVRGARADGTTWERRVPVQETGNTALGALYARARIRALEDAYLMPGANKPALEKEILALSLGHNVLCRFTSFVAVDHAEVVHSADPMRQVTQPVESPSGWGNQGSKKLKAKTSTRRRAKRSPAPQSRGFSAQQPTGMAPPAPSAPSPMAPGSGAPGNFGGARGGFAGPPPAAMPMAPTFDAMEMEAGDMEADDLMSMVDMGSLTGSAHSFEDAMAPPEEVAPRAESASLTKAGSISTWAHLMSPEQLRGEAATQASTIYALGALLFHLLTGRTLFGADHGTAGILKIIQGTLPAPLFLGNDDPVARAFAATILRAISHDPAARQPSLGALADELDATLAALAEGPALSELLAEHTARGQHIGTLGDFARISPPPHATLASVIADLARALDGHHVPDLDPDQITVSGQGTLELPRTITHPGLLVRLSRFLRGGKAPSGRGSFWK